jgi:hypothetical protein
MPVDVSVKETLYQNPLASAADVAGFRLEGQAAMSFPLGRLRLENVLDPSLGQGSNLVLWCPETFPADVRISWDFWPLREPGLAMLFLAARGRNGADLFDPALAGRNGPYDQYHQGDIDAYHVSYFRRRGFIAEEQGMHLTNLRKSYGFHLVAQGADPIPSVVHAAPPYRLELTMCGGEIEFEIAGITTFRWRDRGDVGGPPLGEGKIGFRQMAPLIAEYANLRVDRVA